MSTVSKVQPTPAAVEGTPAKSGVALLATLLLVAALMILGLLYLLQVRLERRTTDYQHAAAQARAGLETALSRAMESMAETYEDRVYAVPGQDHEWYSEAEGDVAGAWFDADDVAEWGWPERVRGSGEGSVFERAEKAEWVIVGDPDEWHLAIAWVGADLTGLLDPNVVGTVSSRYPQSGPWAIPTGELQFESSGRKYFTPGEFEADHPSATKVFMPGSWSKDDGWYDDGVWRQSVTIGEHELSMHPHWSREQIQAVMAYLYPDGDAEKLALAFEDFRENAVYPRDPDIPTVAPIPMFNELVATLTVETTGAGVAVTLTLDVEFWLPFLGSRVVNDFRVSEAPGATLNGSAWPAEAGELAFSLNVDAEPLEPPGVFETGRFTYSRLLAGAEPGTPVTVDLNTLMELHMYEDLAVDRMPAMILTLEAVSPEVGGTREEQRVLEVLDPRLNYREDLWVEREEHSLGEVNRAAVELVEADDSLDPLWAWAPRALNQWGANPVWQTRAIGYFPLDEPWRSVDLFGEDGRWWLRHTRDDGWEPGVWRRGMVNPNSLYREALEAAFLDVPLEKFPVDPNSERLTPEQTWNIAEDFIAALEMEEGSVQRGDWTRILAGNAVLREMDRHAAESVVASMLQVFETRQQLWGVALVAEWRAPGGWAVASAQSAALVWRDPYPDPGGEHAWSRLLWLPSR